MNYLSLFSGIGGFEKALDRIRVKYNLVNYCEIDKHASKAYAAVHDVSEDLNLGDITQVDTSKLPPIDMISYGFPCQDISLAGKQKGLFNEDGTQTRSGLFFEALRIIEDTKPKVAIAENVKNLVSKKFKEQFQIVLDSLEQAGYNNYWQVLNAKDYGIPQNRERVFIVSIRKDIDTGTFKFPEPFELKLRLKDLLEPEVDEKFYISNEKITKIQNSNFGQEKSMIQKGDVCGTLLARDYKDPKCVQVPQLYGTEKEPNPQAGRIYDSNGLSPTMDSCSGGNRMPKVLVREATKQGVVTAAAMRGRYNESGQVDQNIEISDRDYANAITTVQKDSLITEPSLRIRKLTPLECWRLMGFDDEDFYKAEKVCSNTQLYKQAGNSIVVDVLEHLFKEIMEVLEVKKVEDKIVVYECENLINLEALKEKEPELYEELLADYPSEKATYVFKVVS